MKTEFMAAPGSRLQAPGSRLQAPGSRLQAPGSRLQALKLRPQERGSSSKRNLYRLFWTAAVAIALAVVIVPAMTLLGTAAFAHDEAAGPGYQGSWHYGAYCPSQYRISHGDTECMHAWWDNTPPVSTGFSLGSTYGARNKCVDYGAMMAAIDMVSGRDEHFHMSNGDKKRGEDTDGDVRSISCCLETSDLCIKQQVVKRNGNIKVWTGIDTTMELVNVSSHTKRYVFCNDNPDNVYCVNDPEGDAFTVPELLCGPSGNKRECRASDCEWAFDRAERDAVGDYCTLDSYSYEDGFCTLDATCSRPTDGHGELTRSIEIYLRHIKKKLEVCGGAYAEEYYLNHSDNEC